MRDKLVIFGPWCGEFSYELQWWVPEIRKMRNTEFKDYDAIAFTYQGRKILYEDFIDEYIPYTDEIEKTLKYPATHGVHIDGQDVIPKHLIQFVDERIKEYTEYKEIKLYHPLIIPKYENVTLADKPFGEYKHYTVSDEKLNSVRDELNNYFKNDNNIVTILARQKIRNGVLDDESWSPENWNIFIEKLITELNLNIVLMDFETRDSVGGTYNFKETDIYNKHKENIFSMNVGGEDSVERQFALLKVTNCSIYGSTGSVTMTFFVNTPVFTQQCKENAPRLCFEWQRELTDNHKNVFIFNKYKRGGELYNSNPNELFDKFKEFYDTII